MRSSICFALIAAGLCCILAAWTPVACRASESSGAAGEAPFSLPLQMDSGGQPLNGAAHRYSITFSADSMPPARTWTLVMYELPQQLVASPINRHAIDSKLLPHLARNSDGSVTIEIQQESPGGQRAANWLPAPDGPFMLQLRLHEPERAVLDGAWEAPALERVE
jgi:hypothetical protein